MLFEVICSKCGNKFTVDCSERDYKNKKYRKTCSSKCAHCRVFSVETKNKISSSLKRKKEYNNCKICGNIITTGGRNKKCCSDMCKHISICLPSLTKYFDFNLSCIGTNKVFNEYERIRLMLINDYWNNNMTGAEVAEKYNYPSSCNITGKIFKHLDIPTRSCRDTTKLNILLGKINPSTTHTKYISGWHRTWDNKEVFLRSSYEFDYAKELDEKQILYEVENLKIKYWDSQKNEFRCAIPDFYLPETNEIVEIKSNYTLNKTNMIDKFKEYTKLGYKPKLILDKKELDLF